MFKKALLPHPPFHNLQWPSGPIPSFLLIGATIIEISLLALFLFPEHQKQAVPFIVHTTLAFSGYALGLAAIFQLPSKHPSKDLIFVLGVSLLFRMTFLWIDPVFDDDLHRYIWDGRVSSHGINPYLYAPEAHELEELQDDNYDLVSFKNIPTIYPPLMQWIFQGSQRLAPSSQLFLKFLAMSFDLALIAVLLLLLKETQTPLIWILAYAWNPLPIKEFTNSGHLDSLVLFLMFLSLWLMLRKRFLFAHFLMGLSVLAKLFSAITLPLTLIYAALHSKRKLFSAAVILLFTFMVGYLPFLEAGYKLFVGLQIYLQYWVFNSGPFWVIERILKVLGLSHATTARSVCGLIVMSILAWESWITVRQPARLMTAVFHCLAALVLFSPAVQPWYVCWLIPFFVFYPQLPWIVFSGLITLSYLFYLNFTDVPWARALEYGIPGILMAFDIYWKKNLFRSVITYAEGKEHLR